MLDLFQRRYLRSLTVGIYNSTFDINSFSLRMCVENDSLFSTFLCYCCIVLSKFHVIPIQNFHLSIFLHDQIGVGLMVCQQLGGINGVCFYTSSIFDLAGT
jgi:hypothetical protein